MTIENIQIKKRNNDVWYVIYYDSDNKRRYVSTKSKIKRDAMKFLSNFQKELQQIEFNKNNVMLFDLVGNFLNHSNSVHSENTYLSYKRFLDSFTGYIDNIPVKKISTGRIQKYLDYITKAKSKSNAYNSLLVLSTLFSFAIDNDIIEINPCSRIKNKNYKLPQKTPLFFSISEFDKFINAVSNQDLNDLFVFGINTGMRRDELINLTWNQIDIENKTVTVDNIDYVSKSKTIRTIPLNNKALEVLYNRDVHRYYGKVFFNSKYLLDFTSNYTSKEFKKYIRKSLVNDNYHFHTLRHTFASWLVQKNVSLKKVQKLLGHKSIVTTEIYSHLNDNDLIDAVNLL